MYVNQKLSRLSYNAAYTQGFLEGLREAQAMSKTPNTLKETIKYQEEVVAKRKFELAKFCEGKTFHE